MHVALYLQNDICCYCCINYLHVWLKLSDVSIPPAFTCIIDIFKPLRPIKGARVVASLQVVTWWVLFEKDWLCINSTSERVHFLCSGEVCAFTVFFLHSSLPGSACVGLDNLSCGSLLWLLHHSCHRLCSHWYATFGWIFVVLNPSQFPKCHLKIW